MKRKYFLLFTLITYIFLIFFFAVLYRKPLTKNIIRLDLFWSYRQPNGYTNSDNLLNIACFIPIGLFVGLITEKYRIVKVLLVGLLVSLTIEFSQLVWHRGVFDVADLFNNVVGALIGGMFVVFVMRLKRKSVDNRRDSASSMKC